MLYIASAALALYSHYLAALVLGVNILFIGALFGGRWLQGHKVAPRLLAWGLAQLLVFGLFLPWLALYLQRAASWSAAPSVFYN
jgi:uncharacterized membrane protein